MGNDDVNHMNDAQYLNEGFMDSCENKRCVLEKQKVSQHKVFHRKLDFSHVCSKVNIDILTPFF